MERKPDKSKTINNIIITTNEWYTNEKFRRNGIQYFIDLGYYVELWNESAFCFSDIPEKPQDLYEGTVIVRDFCTREEFREELAKLTEDTLLLCYDSDYSDMQSVCDARVKYCNVYGASILCDPWYSNIDFYYNRYSINRIKTELIDFILDLKRGFPQAKLKKKVKAWPPIYNFISGAGDYFPLVRFSPTETIRHLHTYDYDSYLEDTDKSIGDRGYILFVDDGFGVHPEEKLRGTGPSTHEISLYRDQMNKLFSELEELTGKRVIIAAHPKAEYQGDEFGDRELLQYQTYELIKNCSFFIHHWSTVANIGLFMDKPMIVVVSKLVDKMYNNSFRKVLKKYFECNILDLDEEYGNPIDYIYYNEEKYNEHDRDFTIRNKNDNRTNIEIILDEISKI